MKTIDERADMYCQEHAYQGGYDLEDVRAAHISGAEAEHDLLTRWHDPKEPPEPGRVVLVKRNPSSIIPYDLGHIDNDGNWVDSWCGSPIDDKIIGWREIHE